MDGNLFFILSALFVHGCTAVGCPKDCYCNKKFVDCSAVMEFPLDLELDTERIRFSQMNIGEIPPKAFSYLPNLKIIEITNSNIGLVAGCAFSELATIVKIVIDKTVIGSVESYAFIGLQSLKQLEMNDCKIGRLKPFAFYNISNITLFNMIKVNILNFYSHALFKISNITEMVFASNNISDMLTGSLMKMEGVMSLVIEMNTFWNMHCGVLDSFYNINERLAFENNTFYCNCSIYWLLLPNIREKYNGILPRLRCHGPDGLKNKESLANVSFSDIACKQMNTNSAAVCENKPINPDPVCPTRNIDGSWQQIDHSHENTKAKPKNVGLLVKSEILVVIMGCLFAKLLLWHFLKCFQSMQ